LATFHNRGLYITTLTGQSAVMGEWLESDVILTFGTSSLDLYAVLPDLPWSHADDCLHRGSGGARKDLSPDLLDAKALKLDALMRPPCWLSIGLTGFPNDDLKASMPMARPRCRHAPKNRAANTRVRGIRAWSAAPWGAS